MFPGELIANVSFGLRVGNANDEGCSIEPGWKKAI